MYRKWLLLVLAGVVFCPAVGLAAASERKAQAKQAERMCARREFAEAEEIYVRLLDGAVDAKERFGIARKLAAVLAAQDDKQVLAKAAVEGILSDYTGHARLPHAIHEIAEICHKFGKAEKAKDIYAEILSEQPGRRDAIWLVMGQAIADTFAGDEDGAWVNTDKLLNDYQSDRWAAEAVGQVAWCCRKIEDWENARELYQSVVEIWPDNERAIYSQRGVILADIELEDPNAAETATAELFADYSGHQDFVGIVSSVAEAYRGKYDYEKARDLHKYIVKDHPGSDKAMWSQRSVVLSSIGLKDDAAIDAGIDKLLKDFGGHKDIAKAAYQVARRLYHREGARAGRLYELVGEKDTGGKLGLLSKVNLGGIALYGGDAERARAIFDEVLEEYEDNPNLVEAVALMAEAYWEHAQISRSGGRGEEYRGDLLMALVEWDRIIKEMPETEHHTAAACFFSGECYRKLGELAMAIERYGMLVDRWADFQYSSHAQFLVLESITELAGAGQIPEAEAYVAMNRAGQKLFEDYPDYGGIRAAEILLKQFKHLGVEEGSGQ